MLVMAMSIPATLAAQTHEREIDAIFQPLVSPESPGFAVGVIRQGKLIFARGFGLSDLKTRQSISSATNFRLASFTKQFTAMSIMLLVHDGKLHYDDALTSIFPDFPEYGKHITIRNLLNHTSGLIDYEDVYAKQMANTPEDKIPQLHDADVLRILEQQNTTQFPPGSRWKYSNSGYVLLGMIVQKVSSERFEDFLEKRIFAPLGVKHTVAFVNGENQVTNRAFGYSKEGAGWKFSDQSPTSATLGDGGIYSSIDDLVKWDKALADHALLSAAEMKPAITPVQVEGGVKLDDGEKSEYGFGWFLDPYRGLQRMWHDGETSGFRTTIQRFPEKGLTVIVLANRTDANPRELALKVADMFLAQP